MRERSRLRRSTAVAVAAAVLLFGACGGNGGSGTGTTQNGDEHEGHGPDTPPAFPPDQATSAAKVTMVDYAFVGVPASMKGPNVLFEASVRGGNQHEFELMDAAGALVGAIHPFRSGTKELAVVLPPGTYSVVCLVKEGARTHADLGMRAQVVVE